MEPDTEPRGERPQPVSLFWPIVLIGVGVGWLLITLGLVSSPDWWRLANLWPAGLVLIGLSILIGPRRRALGAVLGVVTVAALAVLVLTSPGAGAGQRRAPAWWGAPSSPTTEHLSEPLGDAREARITLRLSRWPVDITALGSSAADQATLLDADITHTGALTVDAAGTTKRTITLRHDDSDAWFPWNWSQTAGRWSIRLSPRLPLALEIDAGSGALDADLGSLQLTSLDVQGGSGHARLTLPATSGELPLTADVGSGGLDVTAPEGSNLRAEFEPGSGPLTLAVGARSASALRIDAGSGSTEVTLGSDVDCRLTVEGGSGAVRVRVPAEAALSVEVVSGGSGGLHLPDGLVRVRGEGSSKVGAWETPGLGSAARQIALVIDLGSGAVTIDR